MAFNSRRLVGQLISAFSERYLCRHITIGAVNAHSSGVGPGFLEMGFTYIKTWGRFADFISFSLNIP